MKIVIEGTEAEITGHTASMWDQLQKTVELERDVKPRKAGKENADAYRI